MDGELEAELVAKARRGDASAAPFLVSCFGERLLGYARAHAPDLSDADREQIVELAVEAGIRAIDKYDPSKGSLEGWFRGQVRYRTLGWRRNHPLLTEIPDNQAVASPEPAGNETAIKALRAALSRLSHDDQLILALRNTEQIAFAEIAQRLGLTEQAARQRHHRAVLRLRAAAATEPGLEHLAKGAEQ